MRRVLQLLIFIISFHLSGQDLSLYRKQIYVADDNQYMPYRLLYPDNYSSAKKYPLVIFLHGSGERGNDNQSQLIHGGKLFLEEENRQDYPAFVVFPQCAADQSWDNLDNWKSVDMRLLEEPGKQAVLLLELTDMLRNNLTIDQSRIYIMGLSMGGYGTYEVAMRRPELFAAALPICGGGDLSKVSSIAHLPFWIFHGDADPVIPVDFSRRMNKELNAVGADVKYTEYPGVGHNSWDNAFEEEKLLPWMFDQKRK